MRAPLVHRPPRAAIDPVDTRERALATLATAIHQPLRHETIVVLLDDQRRGVAVVVVTDTVHPDAAVEVVEFFTDPAVHDGRVGAAVVASVRPEPPMLSDGDADRWWEMSDIASAAGVELLEWFVVAPDSVCCPRDRLGEAPRW